MKRILLFLGFVGGGLALLLWGAGGLRGPRHRLPEPDVAPKDRRPMSAGHSFDPGPGLPNLDHAEGITQLAPPEPRVWRDRLSDETIEIPGFIPWRFLAKDFKSTQPPDAQRQGVLCREVEFLVFREPRSRAEALALHQSADGAYEPLLHQRFTAEEAWILGRLAERLQRSRGLSGNRDERDDTTIHLSGGVHIVDVTQGLDIRGEHVTVWPVRERAEGRERFTLRHEAFVLTGDGLSMERVRERGWGRVAILSHPVLRIETDVPDGRSQPIFDFGPGDFRPAHVSSEGRAILVREEGRRETQITITFTDRVRAEQSGGRSLDAGRLELSAVRPALGVPQEGGKPRARWRLQRLRAEGAVAIEYPDRTERGESYLTSVTTDRFVHDVPREGAPRTVLEGNPVILMRGEIPLLGPEGRLRASCRERAWIGPVTPGLPTADLDPALLQHVALRGQARIERTDLAGSRREDVLEGDEIDLLLVPERKPEAPRARDGGGPMTAVYFAALGHVRLGGTRIRGSTHRLIAELLHTPHPHVVAEGEGSRFEFPDLGQDQRFLGPEPRAAGTPATAGAGPGQAATSTKETKGRWVLHRLRALGAVDIDTALGGPALGIPAHLDGSEVTYERLSNRARVLGAPARIAWESAPGKSNLVETPRLVLDRGRGQVTAEAGVHGELWFARGAGGASSPFRRPAVRTGGDLDGATLSVRTDHRIDIDLTQADHAMRPRAGAEQQIRIGGPVTAELHKDAQTVDRMRSQSLEIGLVYELVEPRADAAPSAPAARAGGAGRQPDTPPTAAPAPTERMEFDATDLRADVIDGQLRYVQAGGGVEMHGRDGRVVGERLTYDARTSRVHVVAATPDWTRRPAAAWLGSSEQRTEIAAQTLSLTWVGGEARSVEARVPAGTQGTVHLFRDDEEHRGQVEWYALTYWGEMRMEPQTLKAGRVRVIRRLREGGARAWSAPTVLWAPSLTVYGRDLLSSEKDLRDIRRIVAEGPKTTFRSGEGKDLVEVWGHRFDFDLKKRSARLTGTPTEDVTFRRAGASRSDQTEITIDMRTGLPTYIRGSRILWHPNK